MSARYFAHTTKSTCLQTSGFSRDVRAPICPDRGNIIFFDICQKSK